ncbi:Cell cycle checkpoint protein rad17 [Lunasporangiospora selenospora]|uniref:Cell cycle checkpoint protein rad17 n=1 Tax=Lunasporangiospora selenospora TaxID=979761 RepID=A0A9P6G2X7_9FUNG|nr:Cell cycle checkpoint protein rad17 [Lunasporangiospora selenospora]
MNNAKKESKAPMRSAPSRQAKTRSSVTTASMYKQAEAYTETFSDQELSDQISEPEDEKLESSGGDDGTDTDSAFLSDSAEPSNSRKSIRSKPRGGGGGGQSKDSKGRGGSGSAGNGRGRGRAKTVVPSPPSVKAPPPVAGTKRKAGNLKFVSLSPGAPHTPSSSTTSTSANHNSPTRGSDPVLNHASDQWAEKYAPRDISEVAVNKQKVANVREWLELYTNPRSNHDKSGGAILVLTGPAGSGKTTVLKMLAQELGVNIVEWVNTVNENSVIQRPSMPGQDRWRTGSVDEALSNENSSSASQFLSPPPRSGKKSIILIEDLPPVSAHSSLKIFQDTIVQFSHLRHNNSVLVIIVSDVFSKQSTELLFPTSDNRDPALTVRTLLPSSILDRIDSGGRDYARIKQIKFNPIAMTFMKKAIRSLVDQEFRTRHSYAPDTAEIDSLIDIHDGDIRAVINSLQFMCYLPKKTRKKYREALVREEEENADLNLDSEQKRVIGQDSSLGIFHAVAKVLYNRRDWKQPYEEFYIHNVECPPQLLSKRRPPLNYNPEKDLIEKLPIEPELYTLMLHQNYTRHMRTIEECSSAIEYLSIADQFTQYSGNSYTQVTQMQPYMTSLSVRGLLLAPTSAGPPTSGGPKKHWWPEWFTVNRALRSNNQSFSELSADISGEETQGLSTGHVNGPGFLPKSAIREELGPMLYKCLMMNPYLPIFGKLLRSSSKEFLRRAVGNYGKATMGPKREFGEGDEGYTEEIVPVSSTLGVPGQADEVVEDSTPYSTPKAAATPSMGSWRSQGQRQSSSPYAMAQTKQLRQGNLDSILSNTNSRDEDPIEDFSD